MLSLKIILAKVTNCKDVIGHILHAAFGTECDVIITKNCTYMFFQTIANTKLINLYNYPLLQLHSSTCGA